LSLSKCTQIIYFLLFKYQHTLNIFGISPGPQNVSKDTSVVTQGPEQELRLMRFT